MQKANKCVLDVLMDVLIGLLNGFQGRLSYTNGAKCTVDNLGGGAFIKGLILSFNVQNCCQFNFVTGVSLQFSVYKNPHNCCQMCFSYQDKPKRCWLGLRPRPHLGNLQRSPRSPTWFQGMEGSGGRW